MWKSVRAPSSRSKGARLNAHYASQCVAAVGETLAEPTDDSSHTAMVWDLELKALVGVTLPNSSVRVGLRVKTLELIVLDGAAVTSTIALEGQTLAEGITALHAALGPHATKQLERPTYDLPEHGLSSDAPFEFDDVALTALDTWFANADGILRQVRQDERHASPVRLWPHHFDIATLIALDPDSTDESARTIGAGLSPGDDSYDEPYWYVTPWPYPKADPSTHTLPIGEWRTEGFFAAILTGTTLVEAGLEYQGERVTNFVKTAVEACRRLLG